MATLIDRIELSEDEADLLAQASRLMGKALDHPHAARVSLVSEIDGAEADTLDVPPATLKALGQLLALMARQQAFFLYPEASELTTKQAAEALGVSRPFVIKLLEQGAIPFRKVGRHRRILLKDILQYRETMRTDRKSALDDMVKHSEAIGGYDL